MSEKLRSAEEILKYKEPGDLYSGNPDTLKTEFRDLVKVWHPDANGHPKAGEVIQVITALHDKAEEMLKAGTWKKKDLIRFPCKDGKSTEIRFHTCHDIEVGRMYISDTVVTFILPEAHKALFENAKKMVSAITYPNDEMKAEMSKYLPEIIATFETTGNELGMVMRKTSDLFLLRDVVNFYGGSLCDRHVAWIESTLLNILCCLDYAKLSHNAISLDTLFISPSLHGGALLGGWWYAASQGSKMLGVPGDTYQVMPPAVKASKCGSIQTDLELARLIGRELLGDRNGTKLLDAKVPDPMVQWLRGAASDKALHDYSRWSKVLTDSFGPRKFIPMGVTADMLYTK